MPYRCPGEDFGKLNDICAKVRSWHEIELIVDGNIIDCI